MKPPKLTVLMPVFNAEEYIGEAIQSVLEQSYPDFELMIIDDGSTDSSRLIIDSYKDDRLRVIKQPHQGVAIALNHGLEEAKGEYTARFDADDICLPGRFEKQVRFLDDNPGYIIVGCNAIYIDEKGHYLFDYYCRAHEHEEIMKSLYSYCPFIHSGVMYRTKVVISGGGYSPDAHNFEDYLLWIQLSEFGRFANLPEQLIKVRFNPGSATIDEKWRGRRFRDLKHRIIRKGSVSKEEGAELLSIIKNQDIQRIKEGAYHALCGKKYLVDNHQPAKARSHISKAIRHHPSRLDNYAFYLLSYFPQPVITWLHKKSHHRTQTRISRDLPRK